MRLFTQRLFWIIAVALVVLPTLAGGGDDLKLKAVLIWGCNDPMPKDENLQAVEGELAEALTDIFKWKHYYEVKDSKKEAKVRTNGTHKFVLSDKCTVEVKNMGKTYEAKLFGEGKLLATKSQPSTPGLWNTLAGPTKDKNAWFVVLTPKQ